MNREELVERCSNLEEVTMLQKATIEEQRQLIEELKEAVRDLASLRGEVKLGLVECDDCHRERTETWPCKNCYPEEWYKRLYSQKDASSSTISN